MTNAFLKLILFEFSSFFPSIKIRNFKQDWYKTKIYIKLQPVKLYCLFLISLFLLNCEGFKKAPEAQPGTDQLSTRHPNPQDPPFSPEKKTGKWGQTHKMICHESQMEQFNTELKKFLSTTIDPSKVPPLIVQIKQISGAG